VRIKGVYLHPITDSAAQIMRRAVTVVVFTVAALTFSFGFGNGYEIGVQLGVPGWIAPLVGTGSRSVGGGTAGVASVPPGMRCRSPTGRPACPARIQWWHHARHEHRPPDPCG
jgi:hypothetical protein